MIWADRIGLVWAIFLGLAMYGTGATFNSDAAAAIWLLGPWLLCRAIHFLLTGRPA